MPNRTRTEVPPEEPTVDVTSNWMSEMTSGLIELRESQGAILVEIREGQKAVEKSTDKLATEIREELGNSRRAAEALERMAKAEEERLKLEKEDRAERVKQEREDRKVREDWKKRIWESQAFQMFMLGLVMGFFQLVGFGYLVDRLAPENGTPSTLVAPKTPPAP
jgi:RNA recognition motif-containing protein